MPYKVGKSASCPAGKPFAVLKVSDGKVMGCHPSAEMAKKQVAALYAKDEPAGGHGKPPFRAHEVITAAEAVFTASEEGKPPSEFEITIVRPGESANRRIYSQEAIARAVRSGFWNGSKMFVDHGDAKMPKKRSLRDLVAGISSTRIGTAGEAIGRGRFFNPEFASFAQEAKDHMGVSIVHDFKGRRFRGTDGLVHEQVDDFVVNHSVDWVAFPAAGGGILQFLQATESEEDVEWNELTVDMLREHARAVYDEIAATAREEEGDVAEDESKGNHNDAGATSGATSTSMDESAIRKFVSEAVASEREKWETERSQQADVSRQVATLVEKSGLPQRTRQRIVTQFDGSSQFVEATVQEAIEEAREELKEAGLKGPVVKGLGSSGSGTSEGQPMDKKTLETIAPTMLAFESAMGITRGEES